MLTNSLRSLAALLVVQAPLIEILTSVRIFVELMATASAPISGFLLVTSNIEVHHVILELVVGVWFAPVSDYGSPGRVRLCLSFPSAYVFSLKGACLQRCAVQRLITIVIEAQIVPLPKLNTVMSKLTCDTCT
jgi:hypothetical protein